MDEIIIREAKHSDACDLSHMINENALHILKPYYTAEQWSAFLKYYSPQSMEEKIARNTFFCAVIAGRIVGCIGLNSSFLIGFYTRLEWRNKGIGRSLMTHLINHARKLGLAELQLAAAPGGLAFYNKNGWQKVKDIVTEHHGVGFPETLMKRPLVATSLNLHRSSTEIS